MDRLSQVWTFYCHKICPSLINVGPSSSKIVRNLCGAIPWVLSFFQRTANSSVRQDPWFPFLYIWSSLQHKELLTANNRRGAFAIFPPSQPRHLLQAGKHRSDHFLIFSYKTGSFWCESIGLILAIHVPSYRVKKALYMSNWTTLYEILLFSFPCTKFGHFLINVRTDIPQRLLSFVVSEEKLPNKTEPSDSLIRRFQKTPRVIMWKRWVMKRDHHD